MVLELVVVDKVEAVELVLEEDVVVEDVVVV